MKSTLDGNQDQVLRRRTTWLSLLIATVELVAVIFILTPQLQETAQIPGTELIAYGCIVSFILAIVSTILTRSKRVLLASWILMIAIPMPFFPAVYTIGGQGVLFGILALVMIAGVGTLSLPRDKAAFGIIGGLVFALIIITLDVFGSPSRVTYPSVITYVFATVLVVIFGYMILRQFPNYPLQIKLTLALLAATLVTAAVIALFTQTTTQTVLTRNIGVQLKNLAEKTSTSVGDLLLGQVDQLTTLSLNETIYNTLILANSTYTGTLAQTQEIIYDKNQAWIKLAFDKKIDDPLIVSVMDHPAVIVFRKYQEKFPGNIDILMTDKYGALVAATSLVSDYNKGDESWWKTAYGDGTGKNFIGQPQYDVVKQAFSFWVVVPVRNPSTQEFVGFLRATYLTTTLDKLLTIRLGTTGTVDLIYPGEKLQMISNRRLIDIDQDLVDIAQSAIDTNYLEIGYRGTPSLISAAKLDSTNDDPTIDSLGWYLVTHQEQTEALAPVNEQNRVTLIIVMAVIGVMSFASILLAQFINRPIVKLTEVAKKIAGGQLDAKAEVNTEDEIGNLAESFNSMTSQLSDFIGTLEARVAERTRAVETTAEVSRRLSTILDQQQLVLAVVEEIQQSFRYYHVHIYLFDDMKEKLVMVGGTGEAGKLMLDRRHSINRGRGLVGQAAETNLVVLVADTTSDPNWLPNPLLPETRAEIAVPIAVGKEILGVLDVQHNIKDGIKAQDAELLQSIANQVAVALQNARTYSQVQYQADREAIINRISQRIQTAGSPELVLQIAARELGRALGTHRTVVQIESTGLAKED